MDLWCIVPYYTGYLCRSLREQSVDVTLGSITYQYDRAHFSRQGIRNDPGLLDVVSRFRIGNSLVRRSLKFLETCINMAWLAIRFLAHRPDILHVQYLQLVEEGIPFELWLIAFAKRLGIKLVYTVHNELPPDTGERYRRIFRRIYAMMDALICHTEAARDKLITWYGVAPERIRIIPHGPLFHDNSLPDPASSRKQLGIDAADCVVLWQGWIKPYKGVPFLLDSWAGVEKQNPSARLIIAGSGDEKSKREIQQKVSSLGMERSVRLELRFLDVSELPLYYSAADILVYPYREITTSGALMTGLHHGKAIVATDLPAFREVLEDGCSALLVPYGETEALATALLALMNDSDLKARLGRKALGLAGKLPNSWPKIAGQTRACYESLLAPGITSQRVPNVS
jgi:glycosyltransferase involved in cell wall biosynthesis